MQTPKTSNYNLADIVGAQFLDHEDDPTNMNTLTFITPTGMRDACDNIAPVTKIVTWDIIISSYYEIASIPPANIMSCIQGISEMRSS